MIPLFRPFRMAQLTLTLFACAVLIVPAAATSSSGRSPASGRATSTSRLEDALRTLENAGVMGLDRLCLSSSTKVDTLPLCTLLYDTGSARLLDEVTVDTNANSEDPEAAESRREEERFLFYRNLILSSACVTLAALAAGLTMGLLSLDPLDLLIKSRAARTPEDKAQADSLLPLVVQHHRLLVTLLLLNSLANEALPLFLDELVSPFVAVILSVTLLLFFGEIIPSAVFTGPDQIKLASRLVPLVKFVMLVLSPVAVPIAKLLDYVLSEEHGGSEDKYNRGELSALVRIQYEERIAAKQRRKEERRRIAKAEKEKLLAVAASAATSQHQGSSRVSDSLDATEHTGSKSSRNASVRFAVGLSAYEEAANSIRESILSANEQQQHGGTHNKSPQLAVPPISFPPASIGFSHDDQTLNTLGTTTIADALHSAVGADEVDMVEGALSLATKRVMDVMTPLAQVFAIRRDAILDEETLVNIYRCGYSRIPVYDCKGGEKEEEEGEEDLTAIRGLLRTSHLIVVNAADRRPLSTFPLLIPHCVPPRLSLTDLINILQMGVSGSKGGHLALVCAQPDVAAAALAKGEAVPESAGVVGIVTLEDAFEEILQEEIYDESDREERRELRRAKWAVKKWKKLVKRRRKERAELASGGLGLGSGAAVAVTQAILAGSAPSVIPEEDTPLLQGGKEEEMMPYGSSVIGHGVV